MFLHLPLHASEWFTRRRIHRHNESVVCVVGTSDVTLVEVEVQETRKDWGADAIEQEVQMV